ncbi:hypothetical protein [Verrucomicrobium sp. BvORR106]|uniref:hypothetical protein n=1 Tax=Verrucomicrobium sp. BvORR106 TaxID=1403819 RepID=UPI0022410280|nr:hypothetical protein [Verrucomicrobium sp. BvORR106]
MSGSGRVAVAGAFGLALLGGVATIWLLTRHVPDGSAQTSVFRDTFTPRPTASPLPAPPLPATPVLAKAAPHIDGRILATRKDGLVVVPDLAAEAAELNAKESTIQRDLEILETLVGFFRSFQYGENPFGGENDEIVAQLSGRNPRNLAVILPESPSIDSRGRLLDRWGTPFHFHPVTHEVLEITSAGPDGKLWTADDVKSVP